MTQNNIKRWHYHDLDRRFWIDAIRTVVPHIPAWFLSLSRFIGAVICFFYMRRERQAIMSNMKRITAKSWAKRVWLTISLLHNYAKQLVSFAIHDKFSDVYWQQSVTTEGGLHEKIDQALQKGKGLLLNSAHLGNWEIGKHILPMRSTKVNMIMVPSENSDMEEYWNEFRAQSGLHIIDLKESEFAALEILGALRNNEIVLIHGDRVVNHACIQVPFFGQKAYFPTGPIELVRITGAPFMSVFFLIDKKDKYTVILDDSLQLEWSGNRKADVEKNVAQMARMYEQYITQYPTQWYAFYDFWQLPPALNDAQLVSSQERR
ncbi:hypothetical protein ACFL27_17555 [candidate division CSSED10-310 bacterium]|uniref:Lipid A biosynthesis acyltransferase n=1 Tax=candidate division CSSED10-310 bacterium TaxID=2855610 RepID=A0ABV6Z0P7_UNCC1